MKQNAPLHGRKRNDYFTHARPEMLRFLPSVTKILDVGCGSGNFGALVKSYKCAEVWGVEVSEEAGREACSKLDNVIIGDFEQDDLGLPLEYFDCIVFNDVLEHLKYPWEVLRNSQELLREAGFVVASIPNVRYCGNIHSLLVRKQWEYRDEGILDRTHLRFFTKESIRDMFISSGYEVLRVEGLGKTEFSGKLKLLNFFLRNSLDDMKYLQFAVVARRNASVDSGCTAAGSP